MVRLSILKHLENLSDEVLIHRWVQNLLLRYYEKILLPKSAIFRGDYRPTPLCSRFSGYTVPVSGLLKQTTILLPFALPFPYASHRSPQELDLLIRSFLDLNVNPIPVPGHVDNLLEGPLQLDRLSLIRIQQDVFKIKSTQ